MTLDAIIAEAIAKRDRRRVLIAEGEHPHRFDMRDGGWCLVHLDTYRERIGKWRVSYFDASDESTGHTAARDYATAIHEAHMHGAIM